MGSQSLTPKKLDRKNFDQACLPATESNLLSTFYTFYNYIYKRGVRTNKPRKQKTHTLNFLATYKTKLEQVSVGKKTNRENGEEILNFLNSPKKHTKEDMRLKHVLLPGIALSLAIEKPKSDKRICPLLDSDWNCSTVDGADGSICYKLLAIRKCQCTIEGCGWKQRKIHKFNLAMIDDMPLISSKNAKPVTLFMTMDELENLTF